MEHRNMERRRDPLGVAFSCALAGSLVAALGVLVVLIVSVVREGSSVFSDRGLEFVTSGTSGIASRAGVWQGVMGSATIAVFVVTLAFPVGIAAAVYLEEYAADTRLTRLVTVNIRNLAGVPSVVYGLLGLAVFVQALEGLTGGQTVIAGGLTLAVLVLPIVIITASEALRAVPTPLREAGYGVGASKWEVTRDHVLPYAAPGILTGTVLALARALGEAAPLILVGAATGFFKTSSDATVLEQLRGPFTALPNIAYEWAQKPAQGWPSNSAAAIMVMLAVVMTFNAAAIVLRNRYDRKRSS